MKLFICLTTVALAIASPIVEEIAPVVANDAAYLAYAVDFSSSTSPSVMSCIKNNGYSVAFIRAYSPSNGGLFDPYACSNIFNAYKAGLGTEVFMTPAIVTNKAGGTQFNEMFNGLSSQGIQIRFVWIQVVSVINWSKNINDNINLINSIRNAARARGVGIGYYTSAYEWSQITGNYAGFGNAGDLLWYWNVRGGGIGGESQPNFTDFFPFGGFQSPQAKQYAQNESVCGLTVNRDVYITSSVSMGMAKREFDGPVVGNFMSNPVQE